MSDAVRQAVFLVGGKGTRLGNLTRDIPKPMIEIARGVRFLDVLLEEAARHGFTDILLVAGYHGDQVERAYAGKEIRGARIAVVRERDPQGTGGALAYAADHLAPWFLMANGDSLFEFNFRALTASPHGNFKARLALRKVSDSSRFGTVTLSGDHITGFREKDLQMQGPALINGGVYLINRDLLSMINGPCSIEKDIFPVLAEKGDLRGQEFDGYFLDIGLPETLEQAKGEIPARRIRSCVFLDRDGVINTDTGYTHKPDELEFIPGVPTAIRLLNESGYYVIVITNQAGVARGYYSEADVHAFHAEISDQLAAFGAHIDAFYHCPFHEEGTVAAYRQANHPDRKPNPGMILRAMQAWPIRKEGSFLIGDRDSDLEAARRAGLPGYRYSGGDLESFVRSLMD